MQKRMIAILCLASLTACAPHSGNYAKLSEQYNAQMADDSADELTTLYPPAATHLLLSQDSKDAYGMELVKKLRENGYALEEGSSIPAQASPASVLTPAGTLAASRTKQSDTELAAPVAKVEVTPNAGTAFSYIVDQVDEGLYRVTLSIGTTSLSRVYRVKSKGIIPAGSWTRRA